MDNNEFEEEEYEEAQEFVTKINSTNRDAVFFAIDCSESMLKPDSFDIGNGESENNDPNIPLRSAIRAASEVCLRKIIDRSQDYVGVLLYHTRKHKNKSDTNHIYVFHDVDFPDVNRIRELNELASAEIDFNEHFGSSDEEFPLANVFMACRDSLAQLSASFKTKRIFVITDQDQPHKNNPFLRSAAITRTHDLAEIDIEINLFSINRPDKPFNFNAFWSEIICQDDLKKNHINTSGDIEVLVERVMAKESPRRSMFSLPFRMGPNDVLTFGVKGYVLCIERRKPLHQWAYMKAEEIKLASSQATYICADTAQRLLTSDIKYSYSFGGEKIVYTADELHELRKIGEMGITLLGFKPYSRFKFHYHLEHPYFIYPDEEKYEGSTRTFAALHQKMLEMEKIAICQVRLRKTSVPRIAALVAQKEELDEYGAQIHPPGIQMYYLPYAEDLRPLPEWSELTSAPSDLAQIAEEVINTLTIKSGFSPEKFKNPALKRFYDVLQCIALDKELPETYTDTTAPKVNAIRKRVGKKFIEFNKRILSTTSEIKANRQDLVYEVKSTRTPRKATTGAASRPKAKPVSEDGSVDVEALWKDGRAEKATIVDIKAYLTKIGHTVTAKRKAELLEELDSVLKQKYSD
ncbi:2427_t:CDS:10 [Ambispora gerdemannii]|uniref:ATP-dependent DNA helicase II subunit 1 n=1 Tax=Ambispora gerdemannii TaxID=144530 RepID=A0A9N9AGD1_9GLOM|nr:2427_t:CDS:10 [Ambispora gerdemannii]